MHGKANTVNNLPASTKKGKEKAVNQCVKDVLAWVHVAIEVVVAAVAEVVMVVELEDRGAG